MDKQKICCTIGHNRWCYSTNLEYFILSAVHDCILKGVDTFINLWSGDFDLLYALAVNQLKKEFPNIKPFKMVPDAGLSDRLFYLFDGDVFCEKDGLHGNG